MPTAETRSSSIPVVFAIGIALCLLGLAIGLPLAATPATAIACGAIVAIGMPHGTLDLDLFKQAEPGMARPIILMLYIGFAGLMAGAWLASPTVALTVFFILAVAHFGEDWALTGSPFLARAVALALLGVPALSHPIELTEAFTAMVGADASMIFVDLLRLVAPVATMVAVVAIGLLWKQAAHAEALGGGLALVAMVLLPPLIGFALFFCLFHSPRHLRAGLSALSARATGHRGTTIVALTLAAAGIAAIGYAFGQAVSLSDRLVAASFTTLSILTLPHMAVPIVLRALRPDPAKRTAAIATIRSRAGAGATASALCR